MHVQFIERAFPLAEDDGNTSNVGGNLPDDADLSPVSLAAGWFLFPTADGRPTHHHPNTSEPVCL